VSTPVPHDLDFAVASRLGALTADSSWPQLEQALRGLVADLRGGDALQLRGARMLAGDALDKLGVKDARQIVAMRSSSHRMARANQGSSSRAKPSRCAT